MKKGRTPGVDGFPCEFYSAFQDKLLPLLLKCALHTKSLNQLTNTQRTAIAALLHKKGDKADLANWRPISLLCVDYKIITSALAARMVNVLKEIIDESQTAGIPGRLIHDNIRSVRDMIDLATEKQQTTVLFSLDQEKAFDRVNHSFLIQVLQTFGFGPNFCNWITTLYSNNISFFQNRGYLTLPVQIKRGVRQGCPLSCYLYVCVAETLAQSIRIDKQIKGFKLPYPSETEQMKTSLYADDADIIIDYLYHERSIERLFQKINIYQKASGSKLNHSKCHGFVIGGTPSNHSIATQYNISNPQALIKLEPIENGYTKTGVWMHNDPEKFHRKTMKFWWKN